jgi:LacI family transcriptional regulator
VQRKTGRLCTGINKKQDKFDPSLVVNTDLSPEGNIKATKELLAHKRKVTAIVVFNDYVAMDAMHYTQQQKIKVNKDVCFVSYANLPVHTLSESIAPLASVEQYPYKQGAKGHRNACLNCWKKMKMI